MKTKYWVILTGVVLTVGILVFRPVPIPNEKDCLIVQGSVIEINEAGVKDIVFTITGQDKTFYINRGLERGLELQKLRAELIDKEVTIKYPKYWTPLGNSSKHISKVESAGRTIFTELN
jgi:hypothetical protein